MGASIQRIGRFLARRMPAVLLVWAFVCVVFLYGFQVGSRQWFPAGALNDARTAAYILRFKLNNTERIREFVDWTDFTPAEGMKRRVVVHEPVNDVANFLLNGGEGQYLEYCPENGCAAVILRRDGSLVHAYPYRPDELVSKRTVSLPYQQIMHDDAKDTAVFGVSALPGGDLIVIYDYQMTVPQSGGIARIDRDGHVLWYRRDYTDHWPKITGNGEILTIGHTIEPAHVEVRLSQSQTFSFDCPNGVFGDIVRVLDSDGHVKDEIPIFDELRNSPYRSYLMASLDAESTEKDGCDPVHANMVSPVGAELAERLAGVEPDDFLVSLRNISAIVIIGRSDRTIKHLFRGPFLYQHGAQPAGGRIILFDNLGASASGGPSRVLLFDPVTGETRTVFPGKGAGGHGIFSRVRSNIDLSADGTRALVAIANMGRAYEIRLADGAILTSFDDLQDVHSLPQYAGKTTMARFQQNGVYYVPPNLLD
jgi:hypothetical protein